MQFWNVMHDLVSYLVPLGLFAAVAVPIILLARYRHNERLELIRQGINPSFPVATGKWPLALGLFFCFIGISLAVSSLILVQVRPQLLVAGIIVASPGLAFLLYYKITAPDREKMMRIYEEQITEQNPQRNKTQSQVPPASENQ